MEKLIKDCVLDDLFDVRTDGFENIFIKKHGKAKEIEELEQAENELEDVVKKLIRDEKIQSQILQKLEDYKECTIAESSFWLKEYYKLGVSDGIELKI